MVRRGGGARPLNAPALFALLLLMPAAVFAGDAEAVGYHHRALERVRSR
jgi:hypothetical protein